MKPVEIVFPWHSQRFEKQHLMQKGENCKEKTMVQFDFYQFFENSQFILGEGAVLERLRRSTGLELDPHLMNAAFCYDTVKREALAGIYRQYLDIGAGYDIPIMLSTPTWRAGRDRIKAAGYQGMDVNKDNYLLLDQLRQAYGDYAGKVVISGLLGCAGDAYNPSEALGVDQARQFHSWQAGKLADTGIDFLIAETLPALSEAVGLSLALSDTGKPYIISFVVLADGTLLDGTPLSRAIVEIDAAANPKPLAFMINCTHPSIFRSALLNEKNSSPLVRERVKGLLANTAALSPEELDNSASLVEQDPDIFGESITSIGKELDMKILGGCCGTDDRHIKSIAEYLVS